MEAFDWLKQVGTVPSCFKIYMINCIHQLYAICICICICILHCIAFAFAFALHCIALHCIALHCIALHCIAFECEWEWEWEWEYVCVRVILCIICVVSCQFPGKYLLSGVVHDMCVSLLCYRCLLEALSWWVICERSTFDHLPEALRSILVLSTESLYCSRSFPSYCTYIMWAQLQELYVVAQMLALIFCTHLRQHTLH